MTLVFRKYDDKGMVVRGERAIEREAMTQADKDSIVQELQADGYKLECIFE